MQVKLTVIAHDKMCIQPEEVGTLLSIKRTPKAARLCCVACAASYKDDRMAVGTNGICSIGSLFCISVQDAAAGVIFLSYFPHDAFPPLGISPLLVLLGMTSLYLETTHLLQNFPLIPSLFAPSDHQAGSLFLLFLITRSPF